MLLSHGADPNSTDTAGLTPLLRICSHGYSDHTDLAKMLLELDSDEYPAADRVDAQDPMDRTALHWTATRDKKRLAEVLLRAGANECLAKQLEARDNRGNTPLLLALKNPVDKKETVESLLKRGADPNAAMRNDGSTPLQVICDRFEDDGLLERFFEICEEINKTVLVDAFNDRGETAEGSTLLHVICNKNRDDKSAKILFKICDDIHRTVQVDAEDNDGNTALQLAVANILPNTVDVLLNHGADLSKCRFPTIIDPKWSYFGNNGLLRAASGALAVAEHLETRGYDFSRSDALTIMQFFAKHGLFEKSSDLIRYGCNNKTFAKEVKKIKINSSLSLYDLIQLRPEEEEKLLTYMDYFIFASRGIGPYYRSNYTTFNVFLHMYEKLSRGFFRRWALGPFRELIHERLPLECCEMVLENLNNRDLGNICAAVAGQSS
ncbi:ankyrin repeat and SOCS box protein 14-like [Trichogramma pretiosum]|uniref:ankyrin repeat and SOCS box protein 14-like n=1 Tax=Trichogramma pretiosum TaxID=7493 RepID=UPI0006C9763B|nr:ankyrin repeat and SOCS box protein 14-like [Trichogramma pretiosum]